MIASIYTLYCLPSAVPHKSEAGADTLLVSKKRIRKAEFLFDFFQSASISEIQLVPKSRASTTLPPSTVTAECLRLPDDHAYQVESLMKLFLKPHLSVAIQRIRIGDGGDGTAGDVGIVPYDGHSQRWSIFT